MLTFFLTNTLTPTQETESLVHYLRIETESTSSQIGVVYEL